MAKQCGVQYVHYYTDGSSARKIAPVFPVRQAPVPKKRRLKRKIVRIDPLAVAVIAAAAGMLLIMLAGIFQLKKVQDETAQMEQYVAQLTQQNQELEKQFQAGYDPEETERMALAIGMVPREEANQIVLESPLPDKPETPTLWQQFSSFLTRLFA